MTSHSPDDEREGYCGACHDWTGAPASPGLYQCLTCSGPSEGPGQCRDCLARPPRVPSRALLERVSASVPGVQAAFAALAGSYAALPGAYGDLAERARERQRSRRLRQLLGDEPGGDAMRWTPAD